MTVVHNIAKADRITEQNILTIIMISIIMMMIIIMIIKIKAIKTTIINSISVCR